MATDATGQAADVLFQTALAQPENANLHTVAWEHFNPSDISVSAQIALVKAQNPQGIVVYATGSAFGNVLRGLHDAGVDVPVVTSAVNMNHTQLEQYQAFMPKEVIFNTTLFLGRDQIRNRALRSAIDEFYTGYRLA